MQQPTQPSVFDQVERSATEISKLYVPVREVFDLDSIPVPNPLANTDAEAPASIKFRSFRKLLDRYVSDGRYVEFCEAATNIFSVLDHQFDLARRRHDAYIEKIESYTSTLIKAGQYSELRATDAESKNELLRKELDRTRSAYRDAWKVLDEIKSKGDKYMFIKNYNSALSMVDSIRASILDNFDSLRENFISEHGRLIKSSTGSVPDLVKINPSVDLDESDGPKPLSGSTSISKKVNDDEDDEPPLSTEELEKLKKKYKKSGPPMIYDDIMEANS